VPHTLQYPLERERDLQRRWNRLLQRTLMPRGHSLDRRGMGSARRGLDPLKGFA
jgi:hypothetical protein